MKIKAVALCDEVRKEDTGKLLLIGVYTNDIIVPKFPTNTVLTLWVHFSPPPKTKFRIEARAKIDNKPSAITTRVGGVVEIKESDLNEDLFITFPKMIVQVSEASTLVFDIKEEGGHWKKAITIPVELQS